MPRRSLALCLVLAVGGLGAALAWLATRAEPGPVGVAGTAGRATEVERTADAAELEGPSRGPEADPPPLDEQSAPVAVEVREAIAAAREPGAAAAPAQPSTAASLRVRVLDQDGVPITRYRLTLDGSGVPPRTLEVESLDGRFELDLDLDAMRREVSVSADGYVERSGKPEARRTVYLPLRFDEVGFLLHRAAVLSGRVVDPLGNAVAGAKVLVRTGHVRPYLDLAPEHERTSDELGGFELATLPGPHELSASADGHAPSASVALELVAGERTEVLLQLGLGGTLHGEVLADGRPVAGVKVEAFSIAQRRGGRANTDEHGHFEIPRLAAGEYEVVTEREHDRDFAYARCTIVDGQRTHVVLGGTDPDAVRVRGSITRGGRAFGGFELVAAREGVKLFEGFASTDVGDDGRFEITLAGPGAYLFASEDESAFFLHVDIPDRREVELVLEAPSGRIAGRVRGPEGPIARARVRVHQRSLPLLPVDSGGQATDGDGRYAFEDLPPGRYALAAEVEGFGRAVLDDLELAPYGSIDDADFELAPGAVLSGRVLDDLGRPAPGASVMVWSPSGTLLRPPMTSDAAGRFESGPLNPGPVHVLARAPGRASPSLALRLESDGTQVDLRLAPAASVVLAAVDAGGRPLRATLSLRDGQGFDHAGADDAAALERLLTDGFSSSSLAVGPLPPGRYTAGARSDDGRTGRTNVVLEAGDERRVELVLD